MIVVVKMETSFSGVLLSTIKETGEVQRKYETPLSITVRKDGNELYVVFTNGAQSVYKFPIDHDMECSRVGKRAYVFTQPDGLSLLLEFSVDETVNSFHKLVKFIKQGKHSVFEARTDEASAVQYFQFYGYLSQQQNMMQDYIRTSTYQQAMLANLDDFKDKVVLDVGAGSGILSFFAVQAGAKKVYAIEASSMAQHAEVLVKHNKFAGKIVVIPGKVEEVNIPERVDLIISEPMGYMLFNERMLESYLHAKKWLKPGGRMFPSRGDLHIAPFTDDALYMEQFNKANFWYQQSFHGVDLSSLRQAAVAEYFRQPIVDTFDIRICMSKTHRYVVDFQSASEQDLHKIDIPLSFSLLQSGTVHGLAFWFDVAFIGTFSTVWLSTCPTEPLTHWYQVRCLLQTPIFVKAGQILTGRVLLEANRRQSYDVSIELVVEGTGTKSQNCLDLKNPFFRYTGAPPQPPPGHNTSSPTENYWNSLTADMSASMNGVNGNLMTVGDQQAMLQHGLNSGNISHISGQINPGSIPSVGVYAAGQQRSAHSVHFGPQSISQSISSPNCSIGGGIAPATFQQAPSGQGGIMTGAGYGVSNTYMIGDYVAQGLNNQQ